MFTYFFAGEQRDVCSMRSEADVLAHIERTHSQVGGSYSREQIDFLTNVFLHEGRQSQPTGDKLADGSDFFQLDSKLVRKIADTEHDELLDGSVPWDEGAWTGTDVNRMDLAGFLLEFGQLCRTAVAGSHSVYFVTVEI